jgi:hypothetical protein
VVVARARCPRRRGMGRGSPPAASKGGAQACRGGWRPLPGSSLAARLAWESMRWALALGMGLGRSWPGNSQGVPRSRVPYARRSANKRAASSVERSWRPWPCWTRSRPRALSLAVTRRGTPARTRSPAAEVVSNRARCLGGGALRKRRGSASALRTCGNGRRLVRGGRWRGRGAQPSVLVEQNRRPQAPWFQALQARWRSPRQWGRSARIGAEVSCSGERELGAAWHGGAGGFRGPGGQALELPLGDHLAASGGHRAHGGSLAGTGVTSGHLGGVPGGSHWIEPWRGATDERGSYKRVSQPTQGASPYARASMEKDAQVGKESKKAAA